VLSALLASTLSVFRTRAALQLEIIALRHQLGVLQRSVKRPKLNRFDRFLWAWFCLVWAEWRSALRIVKPATVIAWHRKGFRVVLSVLIVVWRARPGSSSFTIPYVHDGSSAFEDLLFRSPAKTTIDFPAFQFPSMGSRS
jgi:hypothetical protein